MSEPKITPEEIQMALAKCEKDWEYHLRLGDAGDDAIVELSQDIVRIINEKLGLE